MSTKTKRTVATPRHPERKWGPFHGGLGVAVWINEVLTDSGKRFIRSVTIAPRRYRDPKTGEWQDAPSLRPSDIPSLLLALESAHQFCVNTPLPGQAAEEEPPADTGAPDNGSVPF